MLALRLLPASGQAAGAVFFGDPLEDRKIHPKMIFSETTVTSMTLSV